MPLLDIEEIPEVDQNCCTKRKEDDDAIDFTAEVAGEAYTRHNEPRPPFGGKLTADDDED